MHDARITHNYRKDIDALRGISVSFVVLFHAFPELFSGGFIGVDVFFVISGFLITGIIYRELINDEFSFFEFYNRRIRRLFPALIFVFTSALLMGWLFLFPDELAQLGAHTISSTLFFQNFLLIDELGYFDVSSHYKPLLHLWTLSVEEQYYLVWPIIIFIFFIRSIPIIWIISFITIASFIANIAFVEEYKDAVFFNSLTRFWELGLGSCLAIYLAQKESQSFNFPRHINTLLFWLGITLIFCGMISISENSLYPYWYALAPTLGALLVIGSHQNYKKWIGLTYIGKISYPLYLWHWVVISFCYIYIGKKPDSLTLILLIFLSIVLSCFTTEYIERVRFHKSKLTPYVLASCLGTLCLSGYAISKNQGLPDRPHLSYIQTLKLEFERTSKTDKSCRSYVKKIIGETPGFRYCKQNGINKGELIAVIGDSHAHAAYHGLSIAANKKGYGSVLLANTSCPTLIGFPWGITPKNIQECHKNISQIFEVLKKDERIKSVIISTRGPVYIHGEVQGKFTKESVLNSLHTYRDEAKQNYEAFYTGLKASFSELEHIAHIESTHYILENPELDFLPKEVIPRPFDAFGISTQKSVTDRALHDLRMSRYQETTKEAAEAYKKARVIDVTPYLCDENKCFSYINGNFLYADDDHLSKFGSAYVANKISEELAFNRAGSSDFAK